MRCQMRQFSAFIIKAACLISIVGWAAAAMAQESESGSVVSYIESVISEGNQKLDKARQSSDVSKADCINVNLINAKGYLNIAQSSTINLQNAQSRSDADGVSHYQKLLDLAQTKTSEIETQIKQCDEGIVTYSGETTLKATYQCEYPPCLTDDVSDTTTELSKIQNEIEDAPAASPYL